MKYWNNGFYLTFREGRTEITDEYWNELLDGQSHGKQIVSDEHGYPVLVDYVISTEELLRRERTECVQYLKDTDWIYAKCLEEGLDVNTEYADTITVRKQKRARIREIDVI